MATIAAASLAAQVQPHARILTNAPLSRSNLLRHRVLQPSAARASRGQRAPTLVPPERRSLFTRFVGLLKNATGFKAFTSCLICSLHSATSLAVCSSQSTMSDAPVHPHIHDFYAHKGTRGAPFLPRPCPSIRLPRRRLRSRMHPKTRTALWSRMMQRNAITCLPRSSPLKSLPSACSTFLSGNTSSNS